MGVEGRPASDPPSLDEAQFRVARPPGPVVVGARHGNIQLDVDDPEGVAAARTDKLGQRLLRPDLAQAVVALLVDGDMQPDPPGRTRVSAT
jgi:hypothetical protein